MNRLSEILLEEDPVVRRRGMAELRKEPGPDESWQQAYFDALGDENFSVRRDVVWLLHSWQQSPGVIEALEKALCDEENLGRRSAAMEAFGRLKSRGVSTLERLYGSDKESIRRLVVDSLGITLAQEAFPLLERATEDKSLAVRCAAAEALTRVDAKRSAAVLEKLLELKQSPNVYLGVLLAAEGAGVQLSETCLRVHLYDSLTTPPVLRLLGRQCVVEPLLERLITDRGARQRAALVGVALAYEANAQKTLAAVKERSAAQLQEAAHKWLGARDVEVASAALLLLGLIGRWQALVRVAERENPHEMIAGVYRVLQVLPTPNAWLKDAFELCATMSAREFLKMTIGDLNALETPIVLKKTKPVFRLTLSEETFSILSVLFESEAGLNFEPHTAYRLEARLLSRVRALGFSGYASYVEFLNSKTLEAKKELKEAIAQVTVHETYFFRERPQLNAFMNEVLPALLEKKRELRVWSAGCSTGEEPYTLAILLAEYARKVKDFKFEVMGTDISPRVVEKSTAAIYNLRSFRSKASADVLERYFKKIDKEHFQVCPEIREKVKFRAGNLLKDSPTAYGERFDVVFCRNVLIYFSKKARKNVVERFYRRIQPGGVLLLGHSELLFSVDTQFELVPLSKEMIYARPQSDGSVLVPKTVGGYG